MRFEMIIFSYGNWLNALWENEFVHQLGLQRL